MKRRWKLGLVALPLLALAAWWLAATLGDESSAWARARRGDLVLGVEVRGTLAAVDSSTLGPPSLQRYWNFKIASMAPEGSEVTTGTLVLAFDTTELEQRLLQQQAEASSATKRIEKTQQSLDMRHRDDQLRLAEAEARQRKAQLVVDRPGDLAEGNELARARLDLELAEKERAYLAKRLEASRDSAESQLAELRTQKQTAEKRVLEMQQAIEDMSRKATRDGTVIYVTDWSGTKKKVGDTVWRNDDVIELPDLSRMLAEGKVDEADAGRVAEEQRVTLRLDAHPDLEFEGHIESIWSTVQRERGNPQKVVRLNIELDETDTRRMRPGMRFRGKIEIERVAEALLIPIESVFQTAEGPVVYRRGVTGARAVRVELGRRDEDRVEVLSGIERGEQVSLINLGREKQG